MHQLELFQTPSGDIVTARKQPAGSDKTLIRYQQPATEKAVVAWLKARGYKVTRGTKSTPRSRPARLSKQCQAIVDLLIVRGGVGVSNAVLSGIALKYTSRISELRGWGWNIEAEHGVRGLDLFTGFRQVMRGTSIASVAVIVTVAAGASYAVLQEDWFFLAMTLNGGMCLSAFIIYTREDNA